MVIAVARKHLQLVQKHERRCNLNAKYVFVENVVDEFSWSFAENSLEFH